MNRRHKRRRHKNLNGFTDERIIASQEVRYARFEEIIRSIPKGQVTTYGQIAEAAGYPRGHRLVARFLRDAYMIDLPWHRVIGAAGEIKTSGSNAAKQRSLLKEEGVDVNTTRIDMQRFGHLFES